MLIAMGGFYKGGSERFTGTRFASFETFGHRLADGQPAPFAVGQRALRGDLAQLRGVTCDGVFDPINHGLPVCTNLADQGTGKFSPALFLRPVRREPIPDIAGPLVLDHRPILQAD
jgi:hypothetical protein